jgi:hypothetical protein
MSTHSCPECKKNFCSKQRLEYHITNNVCGKQSHPCPNCGHQFNRKTHLQYHLDHEVCQKKIPLKLKKVDKCDVPQNEHYESYSKDELIAKLQLRDKIIIQLETETKVLKENPKIVNNITNYNNILVSFGQENLKVVMEKLPNLIKDLLTKHIDDGIPYLTKQIHCNQDLLPQYSNVYIDSYNAPCAMVFDDGRFCRQAKEQVINALISKCMDIIDKHAEDFNAKFFTRCEAYHDELDENDKLRKDISKELILMLVNHGDRLKTDPRFQPMLKK